MKKQSIYEYFAQMSQEDFESKFSELAHSDAFSAIASKAFTPDDVAKVKSALITAGVREDWLTNDLRILTVVNHITSKIVKKKTT